jgi:hypothetical protein
MDACFLKSLKCGGLRPGEPRLDTTLGEDPAPAASLNQKKFNTPFTNAVTDCGDLLSPARAISRRQTLRRFIGPHPRRMLDFVLSA